MTYRELAHFWGSLALSWLFMTIEFPLVTALIARLPEAKFNLAAFGVTLSLVMFFESPIFPNISASNALVKDGRSLDRLSKFSLSLGFVLSSVLLIVSITPLFNLVAEYIFEIESEISELVRPALLVMVITPLAVGYRRFYQGILINFGKSRFVAFGTAVRLSAVLASGLLLSYSGLPGAIVGAISFSAGMVAEAVMSRLIASGSLAELKKRPDTSDLSTRRMIDFYLPLSITSMILISIHPMLSIFLSRGHFPIESLAVYPVVSALVLLFKSAGIAYQEVAIASLNRSFENDHLLRKFGIFCSLVITILLLAVAYSPISALWFERIGGLSPELLPFALSTLTILAFAPGLVIITAYQRGRMISAGKTRVVSTAGIVEIVVVFIALTSFIRFTNMVGSDAAGAAVVLGALAANIWLFYAGRPK